jgi:hypothetical protein
LNYAFGLSKIQEEYVLRNKMTMKLVCDQGTPSILGIPKLDQNQRFQFNRFLMLKWKKGEIKAYATTMMKSGMWGIMQYPKTVLDGGDATPS